MTNTPHQTTRLPPFSAGIEAAKNGLTRRSRPRDLIPADQISWDAGFNWQKRQEQTA